MASTIVQDLFNDMTRLVTENLDANIAAIAAVISPLMIAAVGMYAVLVVYQMIYTEKEHYVGDIIKNVLALAVVGAFFGNTAYYAEVKSFVMNAGDDLSSVLVGGAPAPAALDQFIDVLADGVQKTFDKMTFNPFSDDFGKSMQGMIAILIVLIGGIPFVIFCTAYLIVAKFMVGLLLTIGQIFICFAFFPSTRNMFTSWTGQCLNYVLMMVLFTLVETVLLAFIKAHMAPGGEFTLEWVGVIQLAVVFFVSIFLLAQVPVLSSSLTGGVGINGLNSSVSGMVSKGGNLARGAAGGAAKYSGANWLGNKAKAGAAAGIKTGAGAVWNKVTGKGGVKAG